MCIRILCSLLVLAAVAGLRADTTRPLGEWDSVTMAPVKTSIYVGSVALTTGEFRREGDTFSTTYEAKVWPWFFWSETGRITITLPPADLERLARGERIEFKGEATSHKNKPRYVTGRADRKNAATGTIKVRIGVDDTELIFNTTYRFNNVVK
ncbi:hypothetical protein Verru16b_02744 [Lacunisphaera limnophila]|uniref:DUF5666 domain-containing protein n=2 Tax=Lacunisphaera limnophila TaxID=1838286 RepID=A0A1D8AXN6_9BACT|nr:hypothetical protein Verru16b_02744 [Lacunisphaera limnophila]